MRESCSDVAERLVPPNGEDRTVKLYWCGPCTEGAGRKDCRRTAAPCVARRRGTDTDAGTREDAYGQEHANTHARTHAHRDTQRQTDAQTHAYTRTGRRDTTVNTEQNTELKEKAQSSYLKMVNTNAGLAVFVCLLFFILREGSKGVSLSRWNTMKLHFRLLQRFLN